MYCLQRAARLICAVFFSGPADRRSLLSFPTRRSSDLAHVPVERHRRRQDSASKRMASRGSEADKLVRSEEHTSELQSLRHLVCRLLLEKKKRSSCRPPHIWRPAHHTSRCISSTRVICT